MDKYYTVDQISEILNLHPKTIQRYIREGKLKATKVGKSWRVTGHDLSVFTEGADISVTAPVKMETSETKKFEAKASAVVDITVPNRDEAIRISNMLTAALNVKPAEYGQSTMNAQYIEAENMVRVMLWGDIRFMETMISSISILVDQDRR